MNANDDPRLQLAPASSRTRLWLFLMCVILPLGITGIALGAAALGGDPSKQNLVNGNWTQTFGSGLGLIAAIVLPLWWVMNKLMSRHALELQDGMLDVRSTFYRARVPVAELDLDHARVVDLDEHTDLRPGMKSNGYALPGFKSGWFYSLLQRRKSFVAVSDGRWKLWLPTRGKYDLLLEPRDPRALLQALRELAR